MWSGPRNISTAMMRSFSSRSDTYVSDEPFYANYLMRTGIDHPGREEIIESYDTDYDSVISDLQNDIPDNKSIWYQKHMAQHINPTDNLKWTNSFLNCLLISGLPVANVCFILSCVFFVSISLIKASSSNL